MLKRIMIECLWKISNHIIRKTTLQCKACPYYQNHQSSNFAQNVKYWHFLYYYYIIMCIIIFYQSCLRKSTIRFIIVTHSLLIHVLIFKPFNKHTFHYLQHHLFSLVTIFSKTTFVLNTPFLFCSNEFI